MTRCTPAAILRFVKGRPDGVTQYGLDAVFSDTAHSTISRHVRELLAAGRLRAGQSLGQPVRYFVVGRKAKEKRA